MPVGSRQAILCYCYCQCCKWQTNPTSCQPRAKRSSSDPELKTAIQATSANTCQLMPVVWIRATALPASSPELQGWMHFFGRFTAPVLSVAAKTKQIISNQLYLTNSAFSFVFVNYPYTNHNISWVVMQKYLLMPSQLVTPGLWLTCKLWAFANHTAFLNYISHMKGTPDKVSCLIN